MSSPFKRASKWRISILREVITSVLLWEQGCGTRSQKLPPNVLDFYPRVGVRHLEWVGEALDRTRSRAWDRLATREDYDAIYDRYLDQHMQEYNPREYQVMLFRREVEALRRKIARLAPVVGDKP